MSKADLDQRISDAFAQTLTSKQLADLLAEVTAADGEAQAASASANETALNPATKPVDVAAARKAMEDANFTRQRMERASAKLDEMRLDAMRREAEADRQREHAAAIAERDVLARDLLEYDELSRKIVNLLVRLEASNARVGVFHSAEIIARGAGEQWAVTPDTTLPGLLLGVRLPKFRRDGTNIGELWPPRSR